MYSLDKTNKAGKLLLAVGIAALFSMPAHSVHVKTDLTPLGIELDGDVDSGAGDDWDRVYADWASAAHVNRYQQVPADRVSNLTRACLTAHRSLGVKILIQSASGSARRDRFKAKVTSSTRMVPFTTR